LRWNASGIQSRNLPANHPDYGSDRQHRATSHRYRACQPHHASTPEKKRDPGGDGKKPNNHDIERLFEQRAARPAP
jgi:hypothetical protein